MAVPHSSTLFVTQDGAPMRFYVRPGPHKRQLAPLITQGGGVVCRIQEPGAFLLADPAEGQLGPGYISTTYVTDCVSRNRCLSPRAYRLLPPWLPKTKEGQMSSVRGASDEQKGRPAVDLTIKEESAIGGNKETPAITVTTTEGATGEREEGMGQKGNLKPKRADEDDQKERPAVGLTNKEQSTVQGYRATCMTMVTTMEKATGESKENMGQMGNLCPERAQQDDHKGRPAVGLTNKEEGNKETCMAMVTTREEATGERADNMEQMGTSHVEIAHGDEEDHKQRPAVDWTNKNEVNREAGTTMVATTEEEREEDMGQMENLSHGDHGGYKGSSAVNLASKGKAAIQGNRETCTSMVTTTKVTGEREDNMEKKGITIPKGGSEKRGDHNYASRSNIPKEAASSRVGTYVEGVTRNEMNEKNASSGAQKKHPSLRSLDEEQTFNEDKNYGTFVIPDPRTSTPAPGNPELVKDTLHDSDLMKDEESPLEFSRPRRKVASKRGFSDGENQHNANIMQNSAVNIYKNPRDETQERHPGQTMQKSPIGGAQLSKLESQGTGDQIEDQAALEKSAQSPAGQKLAEARTDTQTFTPKDQDVQSAEIQQDQSVPSLQDHKTASALRQGRTAFTKEEDIAILLYIREHSSSSCTVTGNVLWKDMERKKVLGRTWQAMKARYGKYLVNHKNKYKLPPKCQSVPNKGARDTRMKGYAKADGSWLDCALTSTVTQKCDATLPSGTATVPQKCGTTVPNASADIHQNCGNALPCASADIPQKRDTPPLSASTNIPQKRGTPLPSASADIPQKRGTPLPSATADIPQKHDTTLPSASADIPKRRDTSLPSTSVDISQKHDTTVSSALADVPQKRGTTQPCASTNTPRKKDTTLPSASAVSHQNFNSMLLRSSTELQKTLVPSTASVVSRQTSDNMLPSASTRTAQKDDVMLPISYTNTHKNNDHRPSTSSTATLQKGDVVLLGASASTPQRGSITPHGALSGNTLVTNIASREGSTLTPRKRSSDSTNDKESSPPKKGSRMLSPPHSTKTAPPDRRYLISDSEDLHIFERANMEFEESDDSPVPEQPAAVVTRAADNNNSASSVDETPSTSQAAESESLQEAMINMMTEFKLDVSNVTQALFFNSGELGSARHFLRTGTRPDGYPIWEPKDDLDLQKDNLKMQSHLINKYGADNVARRVAFLAS